MSIVRCGHCEQPYDSDYLDYCPSCDNKEPHEIDTDHKGNLGDTCQWCGVEILAEEEVGRLRTRHRQAINYERQCQADDDWRKARREERRSYED